MGKSRGQRDKCKVRIVYNPRKGNTKNVKNHMDKYHGKFVDDFKAKKNEEKNKRHLVGMEKYVTKKSKIERLKSLEGVFEINASKRKNIQKKHILIIDDSPTEIQKLTSILIEANNNYRVSASETAEEGLEDAKSLKPDLILMDVVMPGLNGFQATRKLSKDKVTCNIPVIIVSTKDQATDRMWGMKQGAKAYLVKPVDKDKLLEAVESALSS